MSSRNQEIRELRRELRSVRIERTILWCGLFVVTALIALA